MEENMEDINIRIQELDKTVCDNIELIGFASRGLISQNILSQSRNLVEHMAMKAYSLEHNLTVDYPDLKSSLEYIKTDDKYLFCENFICYFKNLDLIMVQAMREQNDLLLNIINTL